MKEDTNRPSHCDICGRERFVGYLRLPDHFTACQPCCETMSPKAYQEMVNKHILSDQASR